MVGYFRRGPDSEQCASMLPGLSRTLIFLQVQIMCHDGSLWSQTGARPRGTLTFRPSRGLGQLGKEGFSGGWLLSLAHLSLALGLEAKVFSGRIETLCCLSLWERLRGMVPF